MKDSYAVLVLYGFAIAAGAILLVWKLFAGDFGAGLIAVFLLGAALFWIQLAKLRVPDSWLSKGMTAEFRAVEPWQPLLGVVCVYVLDSGLLVAGLYLAFVCSLGRAFSPVDPRFLLSCVASIILTVPVLGVFSGSMDRFHAGPMSRRAEAFMILKETLLVAILMSAGMGLVFLWKPFPLSALILGDVFGSLLLGMSRLIVLWTAEASSRIVTVKETDEPLEPAVAKSR